MDFEGIMFVIILIGGLFVGFFGINFYRYSAILMSAAGGFMLGRVVNEHLIANIIGEGVFRESSSSSATSFVLAVFVLGGAALGAFLYKAMPIAVAGIGAAFMMAKAFQCLMGADIMSAFIGATIGAVGGAIIAAVAVKVERFAMIIFMALIGARMAGYTAASFLVKTSIGASLAKPFVGLFNTRFPAEAGELALFLELFIVLTVLGVVVQAIVRND